MIDFRTNLSLCEWLCNVSLIATNLSIDPQLLEKALEVSGEKTKKAAVTQALLEFIAKGERARVKELFGQLDWEWLWLQKASLPIVSLLVDTSVWSLAMRRDGPVSCPEVDLLVNAIDSGEEIFVGMLYCNDKLSVVITQIIGAWRPALLERGGTLCTLALLLGALG